MSGGGGDDKAPQVMEKKMMPCIDDCVQTIKSGNWSACMCERAQKAISCLVNQYAN